MSNDTVDPITAWKWIEQKFDKMNLTPSLDFLRVLGIPVHDGDENMPLSWHIRNQLEREAKRPHLRNPLPVAEPEVRTHD